MYNFADFPSHKTMLKLVVAMNPRLESNPRIKPSFVVEAPEIMTKIFNTKLVIRLEIKDMI